MEETFKVIIYNSKKNFTIYSKITAKNYFEARELAEMMYGGDGITLTVI